MQAHAARNRCGAGCIVRERLSRRFPFLLLASAFLVFPTAQASRAATIAGRVFTADHPDSIAPGAPVSLVFRPPGGEVQRLQADADGQGHFHFLGLSADSAIAYVLRIDFKGMQFLSSPIHFAPGEDEIDYNVLLAGGMPEGKMPSGHPSLSGAPPLGNPLRPNPLHMLLLVVWVVMIFALIALIARRKSPAQEWQTLPPASRELVRDIASLDNRHADGVIGEDEYRKVRESLMNRLRSLSAKGQGA